MCGVTEAGSNSPDRPQTVEIHVALFINTEVNISVNMQRQVPTKRKCCTDTALNDEIVVTKCKVHTIQTLQKTVKWQNNSIFRSNRRTFQS